MADYTWKANAIEATRGAGSRFGCILLAALGEGRDTLPRFGLRATVTSDGYVMCDFTGRDGRHHFGALVGSRREVLDNANALGRHLGLPVAERAEVLQVIGLWLGDSAYRYQ